MTTNFDSIAGWEGYKPPSQFPRPPIPGTYTFERTEEEGSKGRFDYNDEEHSWYNFRAEIVEGDFSGRTVFVSANTMKSDYTGTSSAQDYIMATGTAPKPIHDLDGWDEAVFDATGEFQARTNWEWRCSSCKETFLKGAKNPKVPKKYEGRAMNIPKREADGLVNHVQACPECKQETGANLVITGFIVRRTDLEQPTTPKAAPVAG